MARRPTKRKTSTPEVLPREEKTKEEETIPDLEFEADSEFLPADDTSRAANDREDSLPAVSSRAVSPSDPLRRYLEEVRRTPLLTPEEEMSLAVRLRDHGDTHAAKALIQANLRLVVKIAHEYRSIYTNLMDLIQEGNMGLMKAVSKFDPSKGARLGYYSSWWIRSYILKYLIDNFRLVKIGTTQAQKKLFYHLIREKERLENQGLIAGPKLLAERLDVREKDVIEMQSRLSGSGAELSLDTPIRARSSDSRDFSYAEILPDEREGAESRMEREELLGILEERLPEFRQGLTEREQTLLQERILAEPPKTLQEVADRYGLTRERVRQIEAKLLEKLREFLKLSS